MSLMVPDKVLEEGYKDLIKPSIIELGKSVSLIPRTVKNIFASLEKWNMNQEYAVREFEQSLKKIRK